MAASQVRLQARRIMAARKKSARGFAKPKVLKGPTGRKLKIRA